MAKHPHRLILQHKKTWRCTLQGCTFFVHLGLAHILIGKTCICWDCSEQFIVDEGALTEDMPRCIDCRTSRVLDSVEEKVTLAKEGVIDASELSPEKRAMYKSLGLLK